jgi:hypothetical protein
MLLLTVIAAFFAVVVVVPRLGMYGGGRERPLGHVSQVWLAKHRASEQPPR